MSDGFFSLSSGSHTKCIFIQSINIAMRYREFKYISRLNEANMAVRHYTEPKYEPLLDKLTNFVSAYNKIKVQPSAKNPAEIIDIEDPKSVIDQINKNIDKIKDGKEPSKLSVDLGGGKKVSMVHIHKDQTSKKVIKVIGNILEGLTGLAVATLLAKKGDVTADTMKEIGTKLPTGRKISTPSSIKTERGQGKDIVKFRFSAPTEAEEDLLQDLIKWNFDVEKHLDEINKEYQFGSQDQIRRLGNQCKIVVGYANTGTAPMNALSKFKAEAFNDKVIQTITIQSDGGDAEKQAVTKVDLFVNVKDPNKGDYQEKLTSIKSGSGTHQVGQVSGKTFNHLRRFWRSALNLDLDRNYLGNFTVGTTHQLLKKAITPTYKWAVTQANNLLKQDNEANEKQFLKNLTLGLRYHSQLNNPDLKMGDENVTVFIANDVPKDGGGFDELQFNDANFTKVMQHFDLAVTKVGGTANEVKFQIIAKPSAKIDLNALPDYLKSKMKKGLVPGKYLVQFRSKVESRTTIRNYVEIGSQASLLANVKNAVEQKPKTPTPAPAPTPTPPPPQNKTAVQPQGTI